MTDIIFHIGFPKTATTHLQKGVFASLHALGHGSRISKAKKLEKEIRNIALHASPEIWKTPQGKNLANRMLEIAGSDKTILYSSEYWLPGPWHFYTSDRQPRLPEKYSHLAIEHLSEFKKQVWHNMGRVRVMVTLRNQSTWLASLYAQLSHRRSSPSQEDFEKLVFLTLEDSSAKGKLFSNYHILYKNLSDALGRDNVLFLFFEEMGREKFWAAFEQWSGLHIDEKQKKTGEKYKVRSVEPNKWQIRPPRASNPKPVSVTGRIVQSITKKVSKKIGKAGENKAETGLIEISPELSEYIYNHFSDSNRALAKELNVDLSQYGYY